MNQLEEKYKSLVAMFGVNCSIWSMIHTKYMPSMFCIENRKSIIAEYLVKNPKYVSITNMTKRWDKLKNELVHFEFCKYEGEELILDLNLGNLYRFSNRWGRVDDCIWPHLNRDGEDITIYYDGFISDTYDEDYYKQYGFKVVYNEFKKELIDFKDMQEIRKKNGWRKHDFDIAVCHIYEFVNLDH